MKVYHTSNTRVEKPDTTHSRAHLDFGRGFYLTTIKEQAVSYAERFTRRGQSAWLNVYDLDENFEEFKVKRFEAYDEEWLNFVINCRSSEALEEFDVIIGGIANDKVFQTIDLFFDGLISKEEALQRLIYEKPNMQICICAEAVLEKHLTFIEGIEL